KTIRAAETHGKYVMKGVGFPWVKNAKKFIEMGCQLIEIGHDITLLSSMWKKLGQKMKGIKK
ncbi:MAG: hypothetical protein OEZ48_05090, partial [Candidatus Bathyarchaeota archaeon]|nr:hypothetical protein [Candidatus Bathyarchaeota archaeon]